MTVRSYTTPQAFKAALEQRLRALAGTGAEFARRRQLLVFDRFLARVTEVFGEAATLKGGLVLELRLARARSTKDVDLRLIGAPDEVLLRLQAAGRRDLGDFMRFEVRADPVHPEIVGEGLQYDGVRFRAIGTLAGRPYGLPFGVDVAFGEPMLGEADVVVADDVLGFAGVAPPVIRLYPIETHLAEKLHAYTLPRRFVNSRVKDLPDIALLASTRALQARRLRAALELTFGFRRSHPLPAVLPDPPAAWEKPYASMARDNALAWPTLAAVTAAARVFLGPVLADAAEATWDPQGWVWTPG